MDFAELYHENLGDFYDIYRGMDNKFLVFYLGLGDVEKKKEDS